MHFQTKIHFPLKFSILLFGLYLLGSVLEAERADRRDLASKFAAEFINELRCTGTGVSGFDICKISSLFISPLQCKQLMKCLSSTTYFDLF